MKKIYETNRQLYYFKERWSIKILLLTEEIINEKKQWKITKIDPEDNLWGTICQRGGLAEAKELVLIEDGKEKEITIEEYISLYRKEFENLMPIRIFFERFSLKIKLDIFKGLTEDDYKYIDDILLNEYNLYYKLLKVNETEIKKSYVKDISTENSFSDTNLLRNIDFMSGTKDTFEVRVEIQEK